MKVTLSRLPLVNTVGIRIVGNHFLRLSLAMSFSDNFTMNSRVKSDSDLVEPVALHTPIATQWKTLAEYLHNTVVLVSAKTGRWELVRWFSHTTGKRNAVVGERTQYHNAHTLLQCLGACAMPELPIKVVYYGSEPDLTPTGLVAGDVAIDTHFAHNGQLYHSAVNVVLHDRTTTLFLKDNSLYRKHATVATPAEFGLVQTPGLSPVLLRTPISRDSLCTPHLTWNGVEHMPPNQQSNPVSLHDRLLSDGVFKRSAHSIQDTRNSQTHLIETAHLPYRSTYHIYGEAANGTVYRLPPGIDYPKGKCDCEVHVSAHGRVSLNGHVAIDWTACARPLATLEDGVYTILKHQAMPVTATGRQKRKLCLAETEQLYLAQDDVHLEHATKFRKMGTYHDAQRKRRARIQLLYTNAAH